MTKPNMECQSCKQTRKDKGLPIMIKVELPLGVTQQGFRHVDIPTIVCPYCDGETLVSSALTSFRARAD